MTKSDWLNQLQEEVGSLQRRFRQLQRLSCPRGRFLSNQGSMLWSLFTAKIGALLEIHCYDQSFAENLQYTFLTNFYKNLKIRNFKSQAFSEGKNIFMWFFFKTSESVGTIYDVQMANSSIVKNYIHTLFFEFEYKWRYQSSMYVHK
jgi:hypothetical protein